MHSAAHARSEDLTARARIRDAAIEVFGEHGFKAPVRLIAERAGSSAALVIHHYGSKEKLRAVTDDHVRTVIIEAKTEFLEDQASGTFLSQLAQMDSYAWLLGYVLQSLRSGGELATVLYEQMVSDAEGYLDLGVRTGALKPSRDPAARARMLATTGLGSMLLMLALHQDQNQGQTDYGALMRQWEAEHMLSTLELYTEGLFTDSSVLEAYLAHQDQPAGTAPTSAEDPQHHGEDGTS